MIKKAIKDEYFPKPKVDETKKKQKGEEEEEVDTKLVEKFEPFYEGEGAKDTEVTATDEIIVETPSGKGQKKQKPQKF